VDKRSIIWVASAVVVGALLYAVMTPAGPIDKKIGGAELVQLQGAGASVIDVRTPSEFAQAHLPNAVNVPLETLQQAAATWGKDRPIVVYCATGARSANAAAYLAAHGFTKVYDLSGGIASWTGAVVSGNAQGPGALPTGGGVVATNGKPVFIDFASST
jgi:rhodanese-related sulfurtransferase